MDDQQKLMFLFKNEYSNFTGEATKLDEGECISAFDNSMQMVLSTRGKEEEGDDTEARHQKRMYSFKQLFNICNTVANQSEVSDRLAAAENNIIKILAELEMQRKADKDLKAYTDSTTSQTRQ